MPSEVMIASRFKGPRSGSAKTTKTHGKLVFEAPTKQEDMYPIQWPPYDNVSLFYLCSPSHFSIS
jgi:hypothetical protein